MVQFPFSWADRKNRGQYYGKFKEAGTWVAQKELLALV